MKALGKEESPVSEHRTQFNTVKLSFRSPADRVLAALLSHAFHRESPSVRLICIYSVPDCTGFELPFSSTVLSGH